MTVDLTAIRARLEAAQNTTTMPRNWHILYADDVSDLLEVVEAAQGLLEALRAAENWAVAGVTIAHFFNDDVDWPDAHPDARALDGALKHLADLLGHTIQS